MSWIGLFAVVYCWLLVLVFRIWGVVAGPVPTKGLFVYLVRPGILAQSTPWLEPLIVRVDFAGPTACPLLYLNSRPIAWEDLGTVLQKELNHRPPHWPVFLEGGPDLQWRDVAQAIDIVRGANGEVVLLGSATASPRPSH